jgi:predicted N-formylglutamate amidohydrolase
MSGASRVVVSCEHASRAVPARYRTVLRGAARALGTHRGWDAGALELARALARRTAAPLFAARATRLLVDANRSRTNPDLFSEWSRALPEDERERALALYWAPHREAVEQAVRAALRSGGSVVHVSAHSFTPRWKGRVRDVDVGLLYDPARSVERELVDRWLGALRARRPELRLRRNRPYLGTSDGLTTALREHLDPRRYAGIEVEVSQRITLGAPQRWRRLRDDLSLALVEALDG